MRTSILKAALFTPGLDGRWGLPICLWGPPGIGKSAYVREVAAEFGLPCEVLSPGERGEGAFGVVPVPEKRQESRFYEGSGHAFVNVAGSTVLTYPAPEWTERFTEGGIVFVDEMTTVPPGHPIRAAMLGLVHDRRIGGHVLGARVRVVAAANDPDEVTGCYSLDAPAMNRMGHLEWGAPNVDEHAAYMMRPRAVNAGETRAPLVSAWDCETRVLAYWPDAWARAVGMEIAFLRARPALKNLCPGTAGTKSFLAARQASKQPVAGFGDRGWCSDRSWELATSALAGSYVHDLNQTDREEFVAAFIGHGAAFEWFTWIANQDLPDPAELLDGTSDQLVFRGDAPSLDRAYAILTACVALLVARGDVPAEKRQARLARFWEVVERYCANGYPKDAAFYAVGILGKSRDPGRSDGGYFNTVDPRDPTRMSRLFGELAAEKSR